MPRKTAEPSRNVDAEGIPGWVELQTSDRDASKSFYSALFGWEYDDQPMPDGPIFSLAMLAGRPIAVIAQQQPAMIGPGEPPRWTTHIDVQDVDHTPRSAADVTGQPEMPLNDATIPGHARSELDPAPAAVQESQGRRLSTAGPVGEPGALTWNQLIIADEPDVVPFHRRVQDLRMPEVAYDTGSYTIFTMDGVPLAGVAAPRGPRIPNHWHTYFAVVATDKAVALVAALGGTVLIEPTDTSAGRISRVADPQGAAFSVMRPPTRRSSVPPQRNPTARNHPLTTRR